MIEIHFEVVDDVVFKYTPMIGIGEDMYKAEVVMTKEIFQECYKKWIESRESEDRNEYISHRDRVRTIHSRGSRADDRI